jgi:hypothetical protein
MENVEKLAQELNEKLTALESKATNSATKAEVEAIKSQLSNVATKEDVSKINADLDALALSVKQTSTPKKEKGIASIEVIETFNKDAKSQKDFTAHAVLKTDILHNLGVIGGGTFEADEVNVDAALLTLTANSPLLSQRLSFSETFLQEILSIAVPLLPGQALQAVVLHSDSGAPAITGEARTKPNVANKLKVQKVEAKKVAHHFYTTTEFLNRMGIYNQFLVNNFQILINNRLKSLLYTEIAAAGTAFVDPGIVKSAEPNVYDVLLAINAMMGATGYTPTHVFLNEVDVTNLVGVKALDGHYAVYNGQSIFLYEGGQTFIILNGRPVKLIKNATDTQAAGTVTMIDANELQFGVTPSIDYRTNPWGEFFKDNIVEHLMETAFAVLKPENKPNAIVTGSIADIIDAITEPEGE